MSLHAVAALIPDDIEEWDTSSVMLAGRLAITARQYGVTFVLVWQDGWWRVEKIHGGKVIATFTLPRLPPHVAEAMKRHTQGRVASARSQDRARPRVA